MEIQKNIATVIRALKDASGKSLADFSAELEISRTTLQEYLSGKGNPSAATIEHLAKKLDVDPSFLITGVFTYDQITILMKMLDLYNLLSELSPKQRLRFAELLLEMVYLWNGDNNET